MILTLYVLGLLALAVHPPTLAPLAYGYAAAAAIGGLTVWHVGWGGFHWARAMIFRRRFPALRAQVSEQDGTGPSPAHLYVVIIGFEVRPETTARAFQAVLDAALRHAGPTTLVACYAEAADQRLIKQVFRQLAPPERVRLIFVRSQAGGRHAVAAGLRAVVRARPAEDAAVMLMAGDTLLPSAAIERSLPFLRSMPEVDLILTAVSRTAGRASLAAWLALERAERDQMMASMALARRVGPPDDGPLVFLVGLLTATRLIERIERAAGETGDLPGVTLIWLDLIERARPMLYLPDVTAVRLVDHPQGLVRQIGASVRRRCRVSLVSLRRLAAGPPSAGAALIGICLLQRMVSAVLVLSGLVAVVILGVFEGWAVIWGYLLWALVLGLLHSVPLATAQPRVHGAWPVLAACDRMLTGLVLLQALAGRPGMEPRRRRRANRIGRFPGAARSGSVLPVMLQGLLLAILVVVAVLIGHRLDLAPLAGPVSGL